MDHDYTSNDSSDASANEEDLKESLLHHICTESRTFFRFLQINDIELNYEKRNEIALKILSKSHLKFLQRFGMSLKQEHLKYFELQSYNAIEQEEINDNLKHINYSLSHHGTIVRNRRYAALVKLIKDKKFFSEGEMRSRDPLLYKQLIAQYQSREETLVNRRPDAKIDTLVDVLLKGIEHDLNREVEKQQVEEENMLLNDDSQSSLEGKASDNEESSDPESNHEQWGNFDEPGTSTTTRKKQALIAAGERDLLREEFIGIMYSNFLSGKDEKFFDYSTVDENEAYDDLIEIDQDYKDKYFDEDSESPSALQVIQADDDSEDELDIYMKYLEKNVKQKQQEEFQEELED